MKRKLNNFEILSEIFASNGDAAMSKTMVSIGKDKRGGLVAMGIDHEWLMKCVMNPQKYHQLLFIVNVEEYSAIGQREIDVPDEPNERTKTFADLTDEELIRLHRTVFSSMDDDIGVMVNRDYADTPQLRYIDTTDFDSGNITWFIETGKLSVTDHNDYAANFNPFALVQLSIDLGLLYNQK